MGDDQLFPLRLLYDIEWAYDEYAGNERGVYRSARGNDNVDFELRLTREPTEEERAQIKQGLIRWKNSEQQRIDEYGWFHHMGGPDFEGTVVRWDLDTTSQGVQHESLQALQQRLAAIPDLEVVELVLKGVYPLE